jgi:enterochelin esterase family protein
VGLRAPHRFGAVLCQSGSFWWKSNTPDDLEAEWLAGQFADSRRLPLRFHLQVGLDEWVNLQPNRHLHNVLRAKGYPVTYREFAGGHDRACWRALLADGLIDLLGAHHDN